MNTTTQNNFKAAAQEILNKMLAVAAELTSEQAEELLDNEQAFGNWEWDLKEQYQHPSSFHDAEFEDYICNELRRPWLLKDALREIANQN